MSAWTDAVAALGAAVAGWWRLGEPSGNFADSTAGARTLTVSGSTVTYGVTGPLVGDSNKAAAFAGTNPVAQTPYAAAFDNNVFTVACWFKTGTLAAANALIARDHQTGGRRFQVSLDATGHLVFTIINTAGTAYIATSPGTYADGAWHLVTCVYNQALGTTNRQRIYVDNSPTFVTENGGANGVNAAGTGIPFSVGNGTRTTQAPANSTIDEVLYLPGTALTGAQHQALWQAGAVGYPAPGIPTSVAASVVSSTVLSLSWAAPASGGPVTSYDVRLNGGTPVTATSPHSFTGLTPATAYTLEVRAVGTGGTSAWVSVSATTDPAGPTTAYRADIRVGAHTWTIDAGDTADPDAVNVLDGASFTWAAPDDAGWPPPLHVVDRDVCTLRLYTPDAQDVGDIRRGDVVRFKFTPTGHMFDAPLLDFAGRVRAVKVTDRNGGGAFLQLTAADHTVTLADWTVAGETPINAPDDTFAQALDRISEVLDTLESAYNRDWVPGSFGNVLDGATPGELAEYAGHLPEGYTIGAGEVTTAFDLFARYGFNMFPFPNYDDTTGELDGTHPFLVRPMDRYGRDTISTALDGCLVPAESVEWQRDYTPNVVESSAQDLWWVGETYGAPIPNYPDWNYLRVSGDAADQPFMPDINIVGITNEDPEPGPWGPYTFTILGWRDPTSVAGFCTIPTRYRTYVTITDVTETWNPNGDTTVAGMLRGATWSIGPNQRWVIDAGLRRSRGHASDTWDGVDPTLTWDDVDPAVTWDTYTPA